MNTFDPFGWHSISLKCASEIDEDRNSSRKIVVLKSIINKNKYTHETAKRMNKYI